MDEQLSPFDPDEVRFIAVRLVDESTEVWWGGSSSGTDTDVMELLVFDAP